MYPRGAIVVANDLLGDTATRPYLVLSSDTHPFHDEECIAAVVTTTSRTEAVELDDSSFETGSLPRTSYVSPWNPVTLKDVMVDKHAATVTETIVSDVIAGLVTYLREVPSR